MITLQHQDPALFAAISAEGARQESQIELIASENIVSPAVREAQGSVLTNKYAEGYAGKRYYGGCEHVDVVEELAIERVKQLFGADFANVQPHSGSQANQAVLLALLQPGDTVMGLGLPAGGHLTHGAKPNLSGKWFNAVNFGVDPETHLIDYDALMDQALEVKPKLIICGFTCYPRQVDFAKFREIADACGAYLHADIAHIAGLVATGEHPSPMAFADVVTSTTHKTLRGPRGGIILTNNADLAKKFDKAVFPGLQGGPLMHVIAGKAVAFGEALQPSFAAYQKQVRANAVALAETLQNRGLNIISGGTDTHIVFVDLTPVNVRGDVAEEILEAAHLTCNKNTIPNDPLPPTTGSGIRLGTPAGTTRGFKEAEFVQIGTWIADVLEAEAAGNAEAVVGRVKAEVEALCKAYPLV